MYNRSARFAVFTSRFHMLAIACLFALAGCGDRSHKVFAAIDFKKEGYPESVASITGLSGQEPWGRWSDANVAPSVLIRFKTPLPNKFTLSLSGQSSLKGITSTLKIGSFQEEIFVQDPGDVVVIPVKLESPQDTIEIIPAHTTIPKEQGVNDDTRKLGIGLTTLTIEE